jgi:hypothetical protein
LQTHQMISPLTSSQKGPLPRITDYCNLGIKISPA